MQLTLKTPIKLIMCDLDGTLLNSRSQLSQNTIDAFKRAAQNGITASIASGRCYPMLNVMVGELGIKGPVISANGAEIVEGATGKLVYASNLPDELLLETLGRLRELDVDYSVLGYDICMFSERNETRIEFYRAYCESAAAKGYAVLREEFFNEDFSNVKGRHNAKILVCEREKGDCERARAALGENPAFDIYYSSPILLEIMPAGIDKGTGVLRSAEYLGLTRQEVAVFGDYGNDLPMFREAGLPVAMGNALPEVKAAAKYVCETNDEDGVAKTIDRIISENKRLGY